MMALLIYDFNKIKLTKTNINKFNSEYSALSIKYIKKFHSSFIINNKKLYYLAASLKDFKKVLKLIKHYNKIN